MSRKSWYIVIGLAILVAFSITGVSIHKAKKVTNEQAMIAELSQLRTAVQLYKTTFHENPVSLPAALDAHYPVQAPQWTVGRDANGAPKDPFGSPYNYDAKSGWVRSATEGYQDW